MRQQIHIPSPTKWTLSATTAAAPGADVARLSVQEVADAFRDFAGMRFQGKVAGVEEANNRARNIALERASAPGGKKNGSFLPHTAKSGGLCVRKHSWNDGYSATLLL